MGLADFLQAKQKGKSIQFAFLIKIYAFAQV